MSHDTDQSNHDSGLDLLLEEKIELKEPQLYQVIMLNDDFTPMEFVVYVLQSVFGHPLEAATKMMLQVHQEGKSRVGIYTYDIAQTKVEKVRVLAEQEEHPLQCVVEPDGEKNNVD